MEKRVQDPLTVIRSDPVCKEQEIRRILGRVYAILLDLAEKETADPEEPAGEQASEPAEATTSAMEDDA
jgi:hypothetical protein